MTNKERFVEFAKRHNIAKSEEILDRRLAIIPALSRKVVETRWGLNGGNYCLRFDALEEKLGLKNSHELYDKSMRDLESAVFAEGIADRNKIGDWNVIVGLGRLATAELCTSTEEIGVDMVYGEKLFESIWKLTSREKNVIFLRFGLDGNGTKTLQEVGDTLGIARERVRQIENKAIRKLRGREFVKHFYIPCIVSEEEKRVNRPEATFIDDAGFTVRTFNVLKRANFNTIEDILNNPYKLLSAGNFSKKTAQEILQVLKFRGIANNEGKTAKEFLEEFIRQREKSSNN